MKALRRLKLWTGVLVALAASCAAAALLTARPGDADLYPARAGEPAVVAYVLADGLGAALVAPAPLLGAPGQAWARLDFERSGAARLTPLGQPPVGPGSKALGLTLSQRGLERLRARLASPAGTDLHLAGRPLPALTTPAQRLALALNAAGVPVTPALDLAGPGLMLDLAWFGGATPAGPVQPDPRR